MLDFLYESLVHGIECNLRPPVNLVWRYSVSTESVHQEGKALGEHIKQSIKALNSWNLPFNIKASQMEAVKARFRSAIMNFQAQERLQDAQLREVIARQYSIVTPEATQQEINEAIEQKQPAYFRTFTSNLPIIDKLKKAYATLERPSWNAQHWT